MTSVKIGGALYRRAERAARELGFKDTEGFVVEAIGERLMRLKQKDFIERTDLIKRLVRYRAVDAEKTLGEV